MLFFMTDVNLILNFTCNLKYGYFYLKPHSVTRKCNLDTSRELVKHVDRISLGRYIGICYPGTHLTTQILPEVVEMIFIRDWRASVSLFFLASVLEFFLNLVVTVWASWLSSSERRFHSLYVGLSTSKQTQHY